MDVFVLQHVHEFSDGEEDVKMIGVYSTHQEAELAADRSRRLPGFHNAPDGFCIDRYLIDEDHWTEGTLRYCLRPDFQRTRPNKALQLTAR